MYENVPKLICTELSNTDNGHNQARPDVKIKRSRPDFRRSKPWSWSQTVRRVDTRWPPWEGNDSYSYNMFTRDLSACYKLELDCILNCAVCCTEISSGILKLYCDTALNNMVKVSDYHWRKRRRNSSELIQPTIGQTPHWIASCQNSYCLEKAL